MSCSEFSTLVNYDPWVVPHQLLPAIATIIGMEWQLILIIVYAWETLEVIFLNCLKVSEPEIIENALISDPVQALMGILVAKILMNVSDMEGTSLFKGLYRTIFWSAVFITPGIPIIFGGDYVWFYLPIWFVALFILHRFGSMLSGELMVMVVIYSSLTSVLVFVLKDQFNSFYTALATGTFSILFSLLLKYLK